MQHEILDVPNAPAIPPDPRNRLAVVRTALANERTLLAYLRTMLGLLAAGGTLLHFFEGAWATGGGVALIAAGVVLFGFGVWRFRQVRRTLPPGVD